jgi:hypothetical protein
MVMIDFVTMLTRLRGQQASICNMLDSQLCTKRLLKCSMRMSPRCTAPGRLLRSTVFRFDSLAFLQTIIRIISLDFRTCVLVTAAEPQQLAHLLQHRWRRRRRVCRVQRRQPVQRCLIEHFGWQVPFEIRQEEQQRCASCICTPNTSAVSLSLQGVSCSVSERKRTLVATEGKEESVKSAPCHEQHTSTSR